MTVTAIISFTTSAPTDTTIKQLNRALNSLNEQPRFVIGTKAQEPSTIQITSEWPSFQAPSALTTAPEFERFTNTIHNIASSPLTTIVVLLGKSVFAAGAAPLVEYVKSDFPADSTMPEFQAKIEDDFARFESIYRKRGTAEEVGEVGLATGWALEQDGVRSFVVVRGWTGMEKFEESLKTEKFREAIPILMGWGMPFALWHVERKVVSEGL